MPRKKAEPLMSTGRAPVECPSCDNPMTLNLILNEGSIITLEVACAECRNEIPLEEILHRKDVIHLRDDERLFVFSPNGHHVMVQCTGEELTFYNYGDGSRKAHEPLAIPQSDGAWLVTDALRTSLNQQTADSGR